jgi:DNA-binding transcriptional regulator PaaX
MIQKTDKRKNRKSDIFKTILKIIASGTLVSAIFLLPGSAILLKEFLNKNKIGHNYKKFRESLRIIEKKKMIRIIQKNGEDFLEITNLGEKELLRYDIDDLKIKKPRMWDGKWRMVLFDIPEKFKESRDALSKKIKGMGFFRLQKSVFIYPYECENEIDFIREFFDVKKFVILLRISTMGEYYDLILKRYFDLL